MSLLDTILSAQGGAAVQQIGAQLGLDAGQTTTALSSLIPTLAAGVHQNAQSSGGLSGLLSALTNGDHAQYVNNPASLGTPDAMQDGSAILGHILGGRTQQVAAHTSTQTGLSADVIQKMMPMAAALLMGAMARHVQPAAGSSGPGANAGGLINAIANTVAQSQGSGGMLGGILGRILGH